MFQKDVEGEFSIRRSTATELLKTMEAGGLIRRIPVHYDARLKKIVLTERAAEVRRQLQERVERTERELTKGFSEAELDAFFDYVARFKANLSQMEGQS